MATPQPTIAVDLRALVPEATGIGVYTRSLLSALAARGGARYLGLAHAPVRGRGELEAAGIDLEDERSARYGVVWQQRVLPRRLAAGDVDLFWSPLHTLPWSTPVPAVITVHDLTVLLYPRAHTLKVRLSQRPFLRRSFAAARALVAVSHATADDLERFFPGSRAKTTVIHSGVDPFFAPASAGEKEAIRDELGCPRGYLLYVGTLEPRKNLALLLDVWERLRADDPRTPPLLLAGSSGWRSAGLAARIEALSALGLRHLGHLDRERLRAVFQGASVFVYPSLYEGFGLPPLEAMACGVPVVASSSSSLPEVVVDAGLLVDPDDREGWSTAIARILGEPALAEELVGRGLERARAMSWKESAEAMQRVLLATADGR